MEIRRSVIGRPNLSVSSIVVDRWSLVVSSAGFGQRLTTKDQRLFWKGDKTAGKSRRTFPFQSLLAKRGGAGVSPNTLGTFFSAASAGPLRSKALNRKGRKMAQRTQRETNPSPPQPGCARR